MIVLSYIVIPGPRVAPGPESITTGHAEGAPSFVLRNQWLSIPGPRFARPQNDGARAKP